jgi:hypothetical protein
MGKRLLDVLVDMLSFFYCCMLVLKLKVYANIISSIVEVLCKLGLIGNLLQSTFHWFSLDKVTCSIET